ncbi:solute carrier family, putative [Schistosoma mansoni]|uniref:solute carrier family, putative n=1 Tax=Schistosoma mansoni TaxID=6183 RepID=UPI00022C84E6|nr:solute carrier family, putative [Schistosoma mansoni]|eukprot:XP_018645397.1 solute carrier family, putative [Schistosoma mansoni]
MLISFSNIIQAEQNATIWCTQYRQLSNRTLDKEFDISHLILHLNEDLNATFSYAPEPVWIASLISIFVISAVGLLGVGVVPLVQKVFFNQVIQYLVALAVGTLTGDAMLHLLPHEENSERIAIMKGLVALGGVYFFFMAEKILSLTSEYRAEKKLEKEDRERALLNLPVAPVTRRLSSVRPSLAPGGLLAVPGQTRRLSQLDPTSCRRASRAMSIANEDVFVTGLSSKAMKSIDILYSYAEEYDELTRRSSQDNGVEQPLVKHEAQLDLPDGKSKQVNEENSSKKDIQQHQEKLAINLPKITIAEENETNIKESEKQLRIDLSDHHQEDVNTSDHGHGHSHGHSHEVPESVAAVAWMVIMGDGLHNFTDGMAIGAAFAQSISGGLSTSVAVFCHELPHELGDFAVLLKTGMRIKEAMFFNIISSILCLFGMLVGIGIGNVESASYWIFAITAGTFIYIALVDMLPELNSLELRPGQTRIGQFIIQTVGLTTGVGIMLVIALFEDSIRVIVD